MISMFSLFSCFNKKKNHQPKDIKKEFNIDLIVPKKGSINAMIFENPNVDIERTIFYNIEIELKKFVLENDTVETMIQLGFIKLPVRSVKDLEHKVFNFPINPDKGYIDGSLYMFNVYNPFDVTSLKFHEISDNSIKVTLNYNIDFEFENTDYTKTKNQTLTTTLDFGIITIDNDILNPIDENLSKSDEVISKYYNINELSSAEIIDYNISYKIKPVL